MSLKDKNSEISILHILPLLQSTKMQVHEKRVEWKTSYEIYFCHYWANTHYITHLFLYRKRIISLDNLIFSQHLLGWSFQIGTMWILTIMINLLILIAIGTLSTGNRIQGKLKILIQIDEIYSSNHKVVSYILIRITILYYMLICILYSLFWCQNLR